MSITEHVVRAALDLVVGYLLVVVITFAVMNTMFYFGPWADPPGIDELYWTLSVLLPIVCGYRVYRRVRADRHAR